MRSVILVSVAMMKIKQQTHNQRKSNQKLIIMTKVHLRNSESYNVVVMINLGKLKGSLPSFSI